MKVMGRVHESVRVAVRRGEEVEVTVLGAETEAVAVDEALRVWVWEGVPVDVGESREVLGVRVDGVEVGDCGVRVRLGDWDGVRGD